MISVRGLNGGVMQRGRAMVQAVRAEPTLLAVVGEGLLTRVGFSMLGFALPLYGLALGMDLTEIGLLYALRTGATFLAKPGMAWAADRFGRKPTLMAAVALRCLVSLLFVFATAPWHLYAIRVIHGAMTAAREPAATALIAEHGDRRRLASVFAWYTTARDVGRSLGYAIAGALIQATGEYRLVFLIACLTSCIALVTVARGVQEKSADQGQYFTRRFAIRKNPPPTGWAAYRGLAPVAGLGLMVAGCAEMMAGLYPVIATQYAGLSAGQAGLAVSVSGLALLGAGPLFGWLSDHVSRPLALSARGIANTLSSLLYIFFPGFGGYMLARVVDDMGKAAFRPTWGALLAEVSETHPAYRARVIGLVDTAYTAGEALGPLLAGLLMGWFGIPVMLAVRAGLALATELHVWWVFKARD